MILCLKVLSAGEGSRVGEHLPSVPKAVFNPRKIHRHTGFIYFSGNNDNKLLRGGVVLLLTNKVYSLELYKNNSNF